MGYQKPGSIGLTVTEHAHLAMQQYLESLTPTQLAQALDNIATTGKP